MKRLLIFTLGLLAMVAPVYAEKKAAPEYSTKAERNLIREGNAKFNDERYHEAFELYEKALVLNPVSQVALYNKAVTLSRLASDDNKGTENDPRVKAAEIFTDIARRGSNPELAEKSLYNLGNMAYNDNQFGQAIEYYKGALRINPDNYKTRQNLLFAIRQQDNQDNEDQQEQQQQQDQQEQEQEQQQQQQQQQQQMSGSAEQILQSMQNKENATRRKTNEEPPRPAGRPTTDKPW